jgi:hypothetical protein
MWGMFAKCAGDLAVEPAKGKARGDEGVAIQRQPQGIIKVTRGTFVVNSIH